jgi:P27 family predicted phage terminase small subunit
VGRPTTPAEKKRRAGNPGKRALPEPAGAIEGLTTPPEPPADLRAAGKDTWERIWRFAGCCPQPWIGPTDYDLVALIARGMDERAWLVDCVENEGATFTTDKGYVGVHPALSELRKLDAQLTTWLGLGGLTPSDRSRLGFAEVKRASKLADLRSRMAEGKAVAPKVAGTRRKPAAD